MKAERATRIEKYLNFTKLLRNKCLSPENISKNF